MSVRDFPLVPFRPIRQGDPVVIRGGVWHHWTAAFVRWAPEDLSNRLRRSAYVAFPGRPAPVLVPGVKRAKP